MRHNISVLWSVLYPHLIFKYDTGKSKKTLGHHINTFNLLDFKNYFIFRKILFVKPDNEVLKNMINNMLNLQCHLQHLINQGQSFLKEFLEVLCKICSAYKYNPNN